MTMNQSVNSNSEEIAGVSDHICDWGSDRIEFLVIRTVGTVAGGLAGKVVAEAINPPVETTSEICILGPRR
jgi:hypothetical protein